MIIALSKKANTSFWIFTIAIFIILIVPALIQDGMFMDGQLYACVAKNLANGIGTFWSPQFSTTSMPSFHEQPPLFFAIQAIFFKLLGNSIYTERVCSFLMACLTAFFINLIWKQIYNSNSGIKQLGWLPIFFWIIIPVCFWAYINNVEETMMGVFVIASVYLILTGLNASKPIYFFAAGLTIFLASMCKGFQGLFPIAAIGFYWITQRNLSLAKALFYSLILAGVPLVIYGLLLMNHSAYESFSTYFQKRIVGTMNNVGATTDNRFELLGRLFTELIPVFSVCILFFIITKIKKTKFGEIKTDYKTALFFFLIGISGSFPLMITLEQRGFYLVTALPYFAIGIAILIAPYLNAFIANIKAQNLSFKVFSYFSALLLFTSLILSFSMIGKTKRDKEVLNDVYLMGTLIPPGSTITIDPVLWNSWDLQCYLVRHFNISLDPSGKQKYFLIQKETGAVPLAGYKKIEMKTMKYDLYQSI